MMVKQNVEIWSFGYILAEAAVWLIHGYPGLQDFRLSRRAAISAIPEMKDGDWFHDSMKVLPIVLKTMDSLEKDFCKSDGVTAAILDKLVKVMLDEPEVRCTAKQAYRLALRILPRPDIAMLSVTSHSPKSSKSFPPVAGETPTETSGSDSGRLAQTPEAMIRDSIMALAVVKRRVFAADAESLPVQREYF